MINVSEATASAGALQRLSGAGLSVWLDGLSRADLASGALACLVRSGAVTGVTAGPGAFRAAFGTGAEYEEELAGSAVRGVTADEAVRMMTTADVRAAADLLMPVFEATGGRDGRVSLGVDPRLAHRTAAVVAEARQLAWLVDRPNVLIGIPATDAGLAAITEVTGAGIGVDARTVVSLERHREVMDAYVAGLERARADGLDLAAIHSVASFPVSPVDRETDKRLTVLGTDAALSLRGRAAVANARLAYAAYEEFFSSERWLAVAGGTRANKQRPLWVSTGVRDPALRDTLYVEELVAPGTVSALSEATLRATADHGAVRGDTVTGGYAQARADLAAVERLGISYDEVVRQLADEDVTASLDAWQELLDAVTKALDGKGVDAE